MLGVWIIPFFLSLHNHYWRFIFFWLIFSSITLIVMKKALDKPLQPNTPRQVYKWFLFIYKICCASGIIGYGIMMSTLMGLNFLFGSKPNHWMDVGFLFMFYGLYYGVLGRDLAEVCADKMASHIGYYKAEGMPTRTLEPGICAVCGNPQLVPIGEEGIIENTFKLSCGHTFHEFCIRGWCIVGKKQTCPYCKEKVDLKRMFCNPWEKHHVFYGQLLDWVRLLVAWQPAIIIIVQGINNSLGLK
ncbi:UNVERIFIED_CONTAM: hypothetical protein GTU68_049742 [Idotea baltica]|nr:hypothetical protein [Idotea baltica]